MLSLNALILVPLHDEASNYCAKAGGSGIFSNINCINYQDIAVVYYPVYHTAYLLSMAALTHL